MLIPLSISCTSARQVGFSGMNLEPCFPDAAPRETTPMARFRETLKQINRGHCTSSRHREARSVSSAMSQVDLVITAVVVEAAPKPRVPVDNPPKPEASLVARSRVSRETAAKIRALPLLHRAAASPLEWRPPDAQPLPRQPLHCAAHRSRRSQAELVAKIHSDAARSPATRKTRSPASRLA